MVWGIHLSADQPDRVENNCRGTVAGVSHFGDVLQYVVTSGDRDLLVLTPRLDTRRFALGEDVWCSWSADDVYLFSARQADVVLAED